MKRRNFLTITGILTIGSGTSLLAQNKKLPNFVFILADDQGWNALSTRMDPDAPGSGSTYSKASREPVVGYDIFPTIMDILGRSDHLPGSIEGGSLLPMMQRGGKGGIKRKHPFLIFRYTQPHAGLDIAIVQGDYKLLKEIKHNQLHLWNLKKDPGEQKNLIKEEPERAERMYKTMMDYYKSVGWDWRLDQESRKKAKNKKKKNR